MSDDSSFSLISRLISSSTSRKGTALHQGIVAIILLVIHTVRISSGNSDLDDNLINFTNWFTYYAIISLLATAYIIISRPFITPEVKYPKCNFCGKPMRTTKLKCNSCTGHSVMDEPK